MVLELIHVNTSSYLDGRSLGNVYEKPSPGSFFTYVCIQRLLVLANQELLDFLISDGLLWKIVFERVLSDAVHSFPNRLRKYK